MSSKNPPIKKLLSWFDDHILAILSAILIAAIPLIPKIPLFDILPGYIVRVRTEDFLVLFSCLVLTIQLLRKKASLEPTITRLVLIYLVIGLLSSLSAIFITKTVPMSDIHIQKLFLHYFRRIEYFSLFFIFYAAVKKHVHAKSLIFLTGLVALLVALYGFGQKYWYWCVYSTMNREFSKGWCLYLTQYARVPSTFGGHYDAGAFIMVVATIMLAVLFVLKNNWLKIATLLIFVASLWLLIMTASRTSFLGYVIGVTLMFCIYALLKKARWAFPRWLGTMVLSGLMLFSFGDLLDRYQQVIRLEQFTSYLDHAFLNETLDMPKDYINLSGAVELEPDKPPIIVRSDEQPTQTKPNPRDAKLPADVYEDIPDRQVFINEAGEAVIIEVPRTYSENAQKYGLSAAIRLDALWPRAIAGFLRNPLLGSGYSTLTKEAVGVFTEAESTDNDFLRALGETGLLGFLSFFGIIAVAMAKSLNQARKELTTPLYKAVSIGFFAASVALLINAIYIDVFEASKVAMSYWAFAGIVLALPKLDKQKSEA